MRVPLLDSIAFVLLLPLQLQLATQDRSSSLEAGGDVLKGASQEEELCHGGGDAGLAEASASAKLASLGFPVPR